MNGLTPAEIKAALLLRGVTQARIARECGCDRSVVANVIAGRRHTRRVREAIAAALGVPPESIWPDEAYRRPSGRIKKPDPRPGFR